MENTTMTQVLDVIKNQIIELQDKFDGCKHTLFHDSKREYLENQFERLLKDFEELYFKSGRDFERGLALIKCSLLDLSIAFHKNYYFKGLLTFNEYDTEVSTLERHMRLALVEIDGGCK